MQIEIVVNGKKVMATIDDKDMKEALGEETKKKKTGYERAEIGKKYYLIAFEHAILRGDVECRGPIDDTCYLTANYYTDENVARNNERADALMRKLRRFSAGNGGMPTQTMMMDEYEFDSLDKFDLDSPEFGLDSPDRTISNSWTIGVIRSPFIKVHMVPVITSSKIGVIAFSSREAAEQAIEEFKDELLWYFTEYDPMPEGFRDD